MARGAGSGKIGNLVQDCLPGLVGSPHSRPRFVLDARNDSAPPTGFVRQTHATGCLVWLALGLSVCWVGAVQSQEPPRRDGATAIILEPPANRDALLDKLRRPDLWIWDGAGAGLDRWLAGRRSLIGDVARSPAGVVSAVRVRVEADRDRGLARLRVEFRVSLPADGPIEVPIALNGLIPGSATESGRDLALSAVGDQGAWAVRLAGQGEHLVAIATSTPIRSGGPSQTIELAIPPAASTEVELIADRPLADARVGSAEPLVIDPTLNPSRASGHLSPRSRLELAWQERDPPGPTLPPVLAARGELAVTVGPGAVETRETWSVVAFRGSTRQVALRLQPVEEVVDVEVDRRPVTADRHPVPASGLDELVIPLAEPLAAAGLGAEPKPTTIVLTSKRPRLSDQSGDADRVALSGHPIVDARSQTGTIGVARSEDWVITPVEGRGVRRVDPRTDLPAAFRGRPEGWLGFEFAEQPFDLGLKVEATVPRFTVDARSTVVLSATGTGAEVSTTLVGRVWQGRVFEVRVLVPPGLVSDPAIPSTGAAPAIRSERKRPRATDPAAPMATAEVLIARFPRALGPGETFTIPLRGAWRMSADAASVGLFQPLGSATAATEVALVSNPTRRFEPTQGGAAQFTRLDSAGLADAWPWPDGFDARLGSTALWLRSLGAESVVPVRVQACPRTIHHRADLAVTFDRTGADVVTEWTGDVAHGTTDALEVAIPPEVADRWVAEAGEALEREPLDPDPLTGWKRSRLKLPEATAAFQVRVRHRQEFASGGVGSDPSTSLRLRVQPIRLLGGISAGQTVRLAAETDVAIQATAPGWIDRGPGRSQATDSTQQVRQILEHRGETAPAPVDVTATLGTLADLPSLVASRVWLRSTQLPAGELATSAHYRLEAHARSVVIRLPTGSKWVRGVAGTVELPATDVELIDPDTYRMTLPPANGSGPVPLRVDSILDQPPGDGTWPAPELVGGVVQQTAWELSLLGTRAGVGVPAGWADENVWYRVGILWKRKPRRLDADLTRWLANGMLPPDDAARPEADGDTGSTDFDSGRHSYLFSRPGPPAPLYFPTYARSTLLLVCSGPVLLLGLLILARRPPPRWVAGGSIGLGFLFVATAEPNTGWLVVESSSLGFALAAIAAAIHATLERRSRAAGPLESAVPPTAPAWDAASVTLPPMAPAAGASSERTVIRATSAAGEGSTGEYRFPTAPRDDSTATGATS